MITHRLGAVQAERGLCLKAEADSEGTTVKGCQLLELLMAGLIFKGDLSGAPSRLSMIIIEMW